ncbi:hypothetical protein BGW36DRAFT_307914 [Talaromyces proteolyticus]|uniref:Uncharacterized protein n=1 Tax=Talaromyces proteolyticus TaxID=1131652 RepID=A0AAD4PSM7_9EURO|nr:uncharacterized protein BGW36DRAFT_307914 [Talaromyces proteolyticus]KAH8689338.1 hypothetical protein BGW36DRAFT_307914 [Talaromyces proteolyticus]
MAQNYPYPEYKNKVVDCTVVPDLTKISGKSVVITGGAGGMGEEATRAFANAGAFVTFGDLNEEAGKHLEAELYPNARFVRCNVVDFESQKAMFKAAMEHSPSKTVDVAIANAGISKSDPVYKGELINGEPQAPDLATLDVNTTGVLYTCHLARFYFMKHELITGRDRCLIVLSSTAGYADVPGRLIYMMSKFAARAVMRCLRRSTAYDGIRVCTLAPWFVETKLVTPEVMQVIKSKGVKFANAADAAAAMIRIVSDTTINGRCFTIVNREEAVLGYYDMDVDDFPEASRAAKQQSEFLAVSHGA